jgi:hypothetical protein
MAKKMRKQSEFNHYTFALTAVFLLVASVGLMGDHSTSGEIFTGKAVSGKACRQGWFAQHGSMELRNGDDRFVCWSGKWHVWDKEWQSLSPKTSRETGLWYAAHHIKPCEVVGDFYTRSFGNNWGKTSDSDFYKYCR